MVDVKAIGLMEMFGGTLQKMKYHFQEAKCRTKIVKT